MPAWASPSDGGRNPDPTGSWGACPAGCLAGRGSQGALSLGCAGPQGPESPIPTAERAFLGEGTQPHWHCPGTPQTGIGWPGGPDWCPIGLEGPGRPATPSCPPAKAPCPSSAVCQNYRVPEGTARPPRALCARRCTAPRTPSETPISSTPSPRDAASWRFGRKNLR